MSDHTPDTRLMDDGSQLYSLSCATALTSLSEALHSCGIDIVDRFFEVLTRLPRSRCVLETLSAPELKHLKSRQLQNLYALAAPDLTAMSHRAMALRTGRVHAIVGLDSEDLVRSKEILSAAIEGGVDATRHGTALSVLDRRLIRDLAWQAEACRRVQSSRQDVLLRITRLVWDAKSYTDLIGRVVEILGKHDEIAGCSVGRPDREGVFRLEAISGKTIEGYLAELEKSAEASIMAGDRPQGAGPTGRAWRSTEVERSVNLATDSRMAPWKSFALQAGFRSSAAIPLCSPGSSPRAVLTLYSAFPGGYAAAEQTAFIAQLQSLLGFAIARIENQAGRADTVPYGMRQLWTALLRSDALQMHYQPLLDLKTGQITKVEALARLWDGERLLTPGEFFPALSPDDFLELYIRGLQQALSQRHHWLQGGIDLDVSLNLPSSALGDIRYFDVTRQVLAECGCAPGRLTLEILETDELPPGIDVSRELAKFKALGVMLAEDDLGSGHSSLNRLRELPFDCVKIDRNIVSLAGQDASNVLRFIYQLTRLGRSLGKSVIVEGVEDAGMLEAILVLGADVAQGYAIARPMPAQQLTAWLGSPPGLPDTLRLNSALGKLARLLIWEERMHLISGDQHASATLANIVKTPANLEVIARARPAPVDSACQVCPLPDFFLSMHSLLPDGFPAPPVQQALIAIAVSDGPDSVAYRSAREQLVTMIMRDSAQR